ncbi:hypothetical protein [Branchiibius sp. NY16-3462-2]|uniref:hypothetical protein n=1 Tax=Branchiibius sp. NY16-3462-2 TaxID=1807500 RepID=UPI0007931143|nr:hypothetical protein [Branchiibius sp. NY16-3462-2]KYH45056.1 hypothetical protein AZH51_14310 [Branchiibius sp. NY16-3462-2]
MNLRRCTGAVAVAFALVGSLAGCGSQHLTGAGTAAATATSTSVVPPTAQRSATELVKAMRASTATATSFQATGTIKLDFSSVQAESTDAAADPTSSDDPYASYLPSDASPATTQPPDVMKVDVAGQTNGTGLRLTTSHDGGTSTMMVVADTVYFRGDKTFFDDNGTVSYDDNSGQTSSSPSRLAEYADQWISTPVALATNPHFKGTLKQLLDETISTKAWPDAKVAAATVTPIVDEGVPAYRITASKNSLVIAADDAATLRSVVTGNPYEVQTLRFSNWNSVPALTAPADAIPSSKLPGWAQSSMSDYLSEGSGSETNSGSGSSDGSTSSGYYTSADASGSTGEASATADLPSAAWATSTG